MERKKVLQELGRIGSQGYRVFDAHRSRIRNVGTSWCLSKSMFVRRVIRKIKKWKVIQMADQRKIVQGFAESVKAVNKSFEKKEIEKNIESYKQLRNLVLLAQSEDMTVSISEIWEEGFVCIDEAKLGGIDF